MRTYKKRVASTKSKTYADYKAEYRAQEEKGYAMKPMLSKQAFEAQYERLKLAKKAGEIKSQPWQELKSRMRYINDKQARLLQKAETYRNEQQGINIKVTLTNIKKMSVNDIIDLFAFVTATKNEGIYGGDYE